MAAGRHQLADSAQFQPEHRAVLGRARAKDLSEQAGGPIANPMEMASSHELAVQVLNSIPGYKAEFKQVFGKDVITIEEVTGALAAFEETLVTPNARFDKWLRGDKKAMTVQELAGYQLFRTTAAWPATTARRWAATRSRRWAWSSPQDRQQGRGALGRDRQGRRPLQFQGCPRCATSS